MRPLFVALALTVAAPALAADAPSPPPQKPTVAMHYPTLEKMLRRFSREAGAARTRG
ncbi:MAG: hypothetical protein JWM53_2717 [bacterium]|jgi:hypothetical protein|nr:hypothetical protein [bacterium]